MIHEFIVQYTRAPKERITRSDTFRVLANLFFVAKGYYIIMFDHYPVRQGCPLSSALLNNQSNYNRMAACASTGDQNQ